MITVTYIRNAKCSDCKFCKSFYEGKKKKHTCVNNKSKRNTEVIRLNDLVCNEWKLT